MYLIIGLPVSDSLTAPSPRGAPGYRAPQNDLVPPPLPKFLKVIKMAFYALCSRIISTPIIDGSPVQRKLQKYSVCSKAVGLRHQAA